jgi:hypothetical protein
MLVLFQKNNSKLDEISKKQDKLEAMFNEQKGQISEILSKFEEREILEVKKGKDKGKKGNEFYHVNICFGIISLFILFFIKPST